MRPLRPHDRLLAPQNVQVNALCPGWVATDMAWQGISEPSEIAGFASFLLSSDARGITGQALDINNGAWMG